MVNPIVPDLTEKERQEAASAAAIAYREKVKTGSYDDRAPEGDEQPIVTLTPDAPVRPEHVPEKFWNAETGAVNFEAWAKAHNDLETKFHQGGKPEIDEAAAAKVAPADPDGTPVVDPAAPKQPAAQPKHITDAQDEYARDGKLTDATYVSLAAQGLDRPTVDAYIQGQEARVAAQDRMAYDAVDGKENFSAMVEWASLNATEAELKAYNLQVTSGDQDVIVGAIKGLYSRFKNEGVYEGVRVSGDAAPNAANRFNSKQEYDAAMREPHPTMRGKSLYEMDSQYRVAVSKKMAASRRAGIDLFNNSVSRG